MASIDRVISISSRWFEKGEKEENSFDKFISYWISFNCFYATMTNTKGDRKALENLIESINLHSYYDSAFISKHEKELSEMKSLKEIKDNREGSNKFSVISDAFKFEEIIWALYQVRNNLFHGSKLDNDSRDKDVVEKSVPVLKIITANSLNILKKDYVTAESTASSGEQSMQIT